MGEVNEGHTMNIVKSCLFVRREASLSKNLNRRIVLEEEKWNFSADHMIFKQIMLQASSNYVLANYISQNTDLCF